MAKPIRIDFVSDVSCPWCVIGLKSLELALGRLQDVASAELHFQPFELNPAMPPGGQDIGEHLFQKYGASPEQGAKTREMIRARGAEVGFRFEMDKRARIYNTFDAHRLLHWAGLQGRQHALQLALFEAYFTRGESPAEHEVLLDAAAGVGLEREEAARVLLENRYAAEVREREAYYRQAGINSVPAIIINERHLISGGQPPEVFEQALREIATTT